MVKQQFPRKEKPHSKERSETRHNTELDRRQRKRFKIATP